MLLEWTTTSLPSPARVNLREAGTSLMLGADEVYGFDGEGRLVTAFRAGRLYKRGLDGRVMEKVRPGGAGRPGYAHRDLDDDEKRLLLSDVCQVAARVLDALPASGKPGYRERLERIVAWDAAAYAGERHRFEATYRPIPILPPDQYMALVLQATEGCHYNQCTFCHFYRGRAFHVKDQDEFRSHVAAVKGLLGAGVRLRHTIFLADANALVMSMERLIPLFEIVGGEFEIAPPGLDGAGLAQWRAAHPEGMVGVQAFLDAFTGRRKTADDFAELAALGLRRVYIGMESGHEPLLRFVRKPSMPDDVRAAVGAAKAAGVRVGVIVMLGLGGDRYAAGHIADTATVVSGLGLDDGDIVYFSPFVDEPGSDYDVLAQEAGIRPLSGTEMRAQEAALRSGLRLAGSPKLARYDVREFIY